MFIDVDKIEQDYEKKHNRLYNANERKISKVRVELDANISNLTKSYQILKKLHNELIGGDIRDVIDRSISIRCECEMNFRGDSLDIFKNGEWNDFVKLFGVCKCMYYYYLKDTIKLHKKYLKLKSKWSELMNISTELFNLYNDNYPFYEYEYNNCSGYDRDVVYVLVFPDHRFYVGQTTRSLADRVKEHALKIDNPRSKKELAISKFKKFTVWVWYRYSGKYLVKDELDIMEKKAIEHFNSYHNGYNSTIDGQSHPNF